MTDSEAVASPRVVFHNGVPAAVVVMDLRQPDGVPLPVMVHLDRDNNTPLPNSLTLTDDFEAKRQAHIAEWNESGRQNADMFAPRWFQVIDGVVHVFGQLSNYASHDLASKLYEKLKLDERVGDLLNTFHAAPLDPQVIHSIGVNFSIIDRDGKIVMTEREEMGDIIVSYPRSVSTPVSAGILGPEMHEETPWTTEKKLQLLLGRDLGMSMEDVDSWGLTHLIREFNGSFTMVGFLRSNLSAAEIEAKALEVGSFGPNKKFKGFHVIDPSDGEAVRNLLLDRRTKWSSWAIATMLPALEATLDPDVRAALAADGVIGVADAETGIAQAIAYEQSQGAEL